MTAQIHDTCYFHDRQWSILPNTQATLFKPEAHGIHPQMMHTACYRGFVAGYRVNQRHLYLDTLQVSSTAEPPELNEVPFLAQPANELHYHGLWDAAEIGLKIEINHALWLGDQFMQEHYAHIGFQQTERFRVILELVFAANVLQQVIDHSEVYDRSHLSADFVLPDIENPFDDRSIDLPR